MIALLFPFAPVAWQRVKRNRAGFGYVPTKTRRFKQDIALWASKYVKSPLDGAIRVRVDFFLEKPKKPANPWPRGDIDNYAKGVQDALNGIAWRDDSQIVELHATKMYVQDQLGPRITVLIQEGK